MNKTINGLAAIVFASGVSAHQEPDFSKLPDVRLLRRDAVAQTPTGEEVGRMTLSFGTMFKIGEDNNKQYYATANHVGKGALPKPREQSNQVVEEWYTDDTRMYLVGTDPINDVRIYRSNKDLGDETIKICEKKPRFGEQTYLYGFNRGRLSLSEGRIGDLESDILNDGHKDYLTDVDALPGASGSPSLLYRNKKFCAYGMLLGNLDGGFFSVSRDLKHTIKLYESLDKGVELRIEGASVVLEKKW